MIIWITQHAEFLLLCICVFTIFNIYLWMVVFTLLVYSVDHYMSYGTSWPWKSVLMHSFHFFHLPCMYLSSPFKSSVVSFWNRRELISFSCSFIFCKPQAGYKSHFFFLRLILRVKMSMIIWITQHAEFLLLCICVFTIFNIYLWMVVFTLLVYSVDHYMSYGTSWPWKSVLMHSFHFFHLPCMYLSSPFKSSVVSFWNRCDLISFQRFYTEAPTLAPQKH